MILEIGTGMIYDAGISIFGISHFCWSSDGKFIIVGTE